MFMPQSALSQMLRKTSILCLTLTCLSSINANVADAQDSPAPHSNKVSLWFKGVEGGTNPSARTLKVTNTHKGILNWTASDDAPWLSLSPTSGTAMRGHPGEIQVSVNTAGLTGNTYKATITLSGSGASAGTHQIEVTLKVVPSSSTIGDDPASLSFTGTQGGANPTSQTLKITNTGKGTLSWSASDDAPWLTVSPSSGTTTTETDMITVSVNTAGLAANLYKGTITLTDPKATNNPQQIPVTFALTASQSSLAVLTWDAETDPNVAGYKVYVGTASGSYGLPVDVGNMTTFKVVNLSQGKTYYFVVTAYDASKNESVYSNEVSKTIN